MKEHVERAWGWKEKFQLESFDKHLPSNEFQIIYNHKSRVGAYLLKDKSDHFWLEMILIDPAYQNLGIGTKLINGILNNTCSSTKPLRFSVIKGNPAINLYKRLGFSIYGEDDNFYKMTSAYNTTLKGD